MRAKKSLGQNFLTSPSIASDIAKEADAQKEIVLEIGPGKGMLTRQLLKRYLHIVAVEKDPDLIPVLEKKFKKEIDEKRLTLINGDILDTPLETYISKNDPYVVVANIPYYITGEILRLFMSHAHKPQKMVLLVQKEVAKRITEQKKGSILSMSIKAYGTPILVKNVSKKHFSPQPKVDSAVLAIENINAKTFKHSEEETSFFSVLKKGFAHKRKTLQHNLKDILDPQKQKLLCDINLQKRAEELTIRDWICLSQCLKTKSLKETKVSK